VISHHQTTMTSSHLTRGIWVWNTATVLDSADEISALVVGARGIGISDIYLYMAPSWYNPKKAPLRSLISSATTAGLHIWGLDGDRAYLHDSAGPKNYYGGINNLIAYNASVAANERFFGFQADNEPQDNGTHVSFHNEIGDHALSTAPGSGRWHPTQAQDREMLMRSWINIHQTSRDMLHAHGLRFGAAMPFWTQSYNGCDVQVNFPSDAHMRQSVMKHMMTLVDDYVVMSYNVNPSEAARRVADQAAYASTLPVSSRPRVFASMEVDPGVGVNVSYADTPGKNSKQVVLQDMEAIMENLGLLSAFKGVALHHWSSWQVLPE
jgi:hypothetical protein